MLQVLNGLSHRACTHFCWSETGRCCESVGDAMRKYRLAISVLVTLLTAGSPDPTTTRWFTVAYNLRCTQLAKQPIRADRQIPSCILHPAPPFQVSVSSVQFHLYIYNLTTQLSQAHRVNCHMVGARLLYHLRSALSLGFAQGLEAQIWQRN